MIGQWVSGIMVILFNLKFNPEVQLHKKYLPLEGKTVAPILTVGIPSIVMNGIGSVMNFGINQILQGFAETATGVFGVYFKLQSFFFMPLFGLNNATISIIAYNYGARKPQRITKTLKISCTAALCIMTAGLLVFQVFPDALLGLFNPSQAFLEIGRVPAYHQLELPHCGRLHCSGRQLSGAGRRHLFHHRLPVPSAGGTAPGGLSAEPDGAGAKGLAGLPHSGGGQRHGDVYLLHQNLPPED